MAYQVDRHVFLAQFKTRWSRQGHRKIIRSGDPRTSCCCPRNRPTRAAKPHFRRARANSRYVLEVHGIQGSLIPPANVNYMIACYQGNGRFEKGVTILVLPREGKWYAAVVSNIVRNNGAPMATLLQGPDAESDKGALLDLYDEAKRTLARALVLRRSQSGFYDFDALRKDSLLCRGSGFEPSGRISNCLDKAAGPFCTSIRSLARSTSLVMFLESQNRLLYLPCHRPDVSPVSTILSSLSNSRKRLQQEVSDSSPMDVLARRGEARRCTCLGMGRCMQMRLIV